MAIPQTHSLHYIKPIPGTNEVQYSENSHFSKLQGMKQVKIKCAENLNTVSDCEELEDTLSQSQKKKDN